MLAKRLTSGTTHDLLSLDWGRWRGGQGVHEVMEGALPQVLDALGFGVWPFSLGGAWIVTGLGGTPAVDERVYAGGVRLA